MLLSRNSDLLTIDRQKTAITSLTLFFPNTKKTQSSLAVKGSSFSHFVTLGFVHYSFKTYLVVLPLPTVFKTPFFTTEIITQSSPDHHLIVTRFS